MTKDHQGNGIASANWVWTNAVALRIRRSKGRRENGAEDMIQEVRHSKRAMGQE